MLYLQVLRIITKMLERNFYYIGKRKFIITEFSEIREKSAEESITMLMMTNFTKSLYQVIYHLIRKSRKTILVRIPCLSVFNTTEY